MYFEFNQQRYMKGVFRFILVNDLTIREFCSKAKISVATLYRARDKDCPMDLRTIKKMDSAMAKILRNAL